MLYRNLMFLALLSSCAPSTSIDVMKGGDGMQLAVKFTKGDASYDIRNVTTPSDLKGVTSHVSLINSQNSPAEFPCTFLQEQGVWIVYSMAGVDPYSVGTAPASSTSRSMLMRMLPGEACTVSSDVEWEIIEDMLKASPTRRGVLSIEYSIPEDTIFGAASGASETVSIPLK